MSMFKKDLTPAQKTKLKSSAQRGLRTRLTTLYPPLAAQPALLDAMVPKKDQLDSLRLTPTGGGGSAGEKMTLYALKGGPLFYVADIPPDLAHPADAEGGGGEVLVPHLKLVHRFPDVWPRVRVDRGAIRFVLSGAALMAPGLTSEGGRIPGDAKDGGKGRWSGEELRKGEVVVVEAEGKDCACAVGVLKMGGDEVRSVKKGVAMDGAHFLGDGLWKVALD